MDIDEKINKDFKGTIAIGPLVGLPSSDWVGLDVADWLLQNDIKVEKFNDFNNSIEAEYIIIVKIIPSLEWLIKQSKKGSEILYAPVDIFHSPFVYWRYRNRLKLFSGFLIHNDCLGELIGKASSSPQFFIEHYLKYQVELKASQPRNHELLWVGHLEYIPSLLKFIRDHKPKIKIRALSDLEKLPYYENYIEKNLNKIGFDYFTEKVTDKNVRISGVLIEQWSERKQAELMMSCVAAFDTKMNSFAHNLKPPTKAQMFIYNKIPFACSEYSFSFEYFKQRGLTVAKLNELDYLISDEYQKRVTEFGEQHCWRVDIARVASSYLHACEKSSSPVSYSTTYLYFIESAYFIMYFSLRVIDKLKSVLKFSINKG